MEEFHLFQHLRLPVLHDGHVMEVTSSDEMIAINNDRLEFVSHSGSEVHACSKGTISFPLCLLGQPKSPKRLFKGIFLEMPRQWKIHVKFGFCVIISS